jgi:putative NADH-flavin reductase
MKKDIKIAIIGGTGKSGKYLVKAAVSGGFQIKLLVRNPAHLDFNDPLIEVIRGDVKDFETVRELTVGCQAIISTLGLGQPPSETSIFSQATTNIIRAMKESPVRKYIVITGLNVDTPLDNKGDKTRMATDWMYKNFPLTTTDKQKEYVILSESDINWTMVRLPLIELTDRRESIEVSTGDCSGEKISATDLAYFLIRQLSDDTYLRLAPFIYNI